MNWDEANKIISILELLERAREAASDNPKAKALIIQAAAELIQLGQPESKIYSL